MAKSYGAAIDAPQKKFGGAIPAALTKRLKPALQVKQGPAGQPKDGKNGPYSGAGVKINQNASQAFGKGRPASLKGGSPRKKEGERTALLGNMGSNGAGAARV